MSTVPTQPGFEILHGHLKDLSVENPVGRVTSDDAARIHEDADGKILVKQLSLPEHWAIELSLRLEATIGGRVVFLIELTYVAEVRLQLIPTPVVPQILHVDVPQTIFPLLQDIVHRNGGWAGYPDLVLPTLDFREIYYKQIVPQG